MNHNHQPPCSHEMKHCAPCDTAYCGKCKQEWKPECRQNHYQWNRQPAYPAFFPPGILMASAPDSTAVPATNFPRITAHVHS